MNTNLGYSKQTLADTSVLTAAGGHALISSLHVGEADKAEELSINSTAVSTLTSFSPSDALYGVYYNDGAEQNSQQGFVLVFSMPGGGEYQILFNDNASRLIGTRYKATSNDNFNDWKYLQLGSTGPEDCYKVQQNVVNQSSDRGQNFPLLFATNTTQIQESYATTGYGYYLNNINSYQTLDVTQFDQYLYYNQYYKTLYAPKIKGQELTLRGNVSAPNGSFSNSLYTRYLDVDFIYLMAGQGSISMDYAHAVSHEYIQDLNFLSMYIDVSCSNSEHSGIAIDGDGVSIYGTGKNEGETLPGQGTTNRSNFSSYTPLFSVKRYDTNNVVIAAYIDEPLMSLNGFHKIGSSDSYVLLGGGSHKALSDFFMSSGGVLTGDIIMRGSQNNTNVDSAKIRFRTISSDDYANISPYIQAINVDNYGRKRLSVFQKNVTDWNTAQTEVFTILPDGKVGIKTQTPGYELEVNGNIKCSNLYGGSYVFVNTGAEGIYLSTSGLSWHNSNNAYVSNLLSFSNDTVNNNRVPKVTVSNILVAQDIRAADDNGLLVYKPSGGWSGISSTQWGVGASNCQGVIRSSATDLQHYRGSTPYPVLDAYNYTNYLGGRPAVYATKSSTYNIEPNKEYYLPIIDQNTTINLQSISNFSEAKVYEYKMSFTTTSSSLPTITINGFTSQSIQWETPLTFAKGRHYELSVMFVKYKDNQGNYSTYYDLLYGLWSVWTPL